jgi:hypothetical protein
MKGKLDDKQSFKKDRKPKASKFGRISGQKQESQEVYIEARALGSQIARKRMPGRK